MLCEEISALDKSLPTTGIFFLVASSYLVSSPFLQHHNSYEHLVEKKNCKNPTSPTKSF
jgi:hypothetical protein